MIDVYCEILVSHEPRMVGHGRWCQAHPETIPATMGRIAQGHNPEADKARFIENELESASIQHLDIIKPKHKVFK